MKQAVLSLFFSLTSFFVFAQAGKITLKGQVQNNSLSSISITHLNNQELVSSELGDDGSFSISAKAEEGYYFFNYGRHTAYIYLAPKDNIIATFDAQYFDSTLFFEGRGGERNNYLAKKSIRSSELTEDLEAFYQKDETIYLQNIERVKRSHIDALNSYNVESFFKEAELRSLEYGRLLSIQNYASNYEFYLGDVISPSSDFYKPIRGLKLDDEDEFRKQPYYRYLVNSVWNKRIEAASDVDGMLGVLRQVRSQRILVELVTGFYSKISSNKERSKDYLDLIKLVTTHQPFIEAAEKRYKEVMESRGLKAGDLSPEFSYESIDGQMINMSDLRGKYLYIDVWATWCAPCIKQVPYLKKLEKRYHDMNIVFVSISVDKEELKSNWKKMVTDRQLGGLQLFADKSFESEFMNAYAVNSIPRFILIDPEGKIVNTEAPRPSYEKTRELLDRLLN